eukprot:2855772-Pleurochrysis_carterae.AAC.7
MSTLSQSVHISRGMLICYELHCSQERQADSHVRPCFSAVMPNVNAHACPRKSMNYSLGDYPQ